MMRTMNQIRTSTKMAITTIIMGREPSGDATTR